MDGIKHTYRRVIGDAGGLSYQPLEADSPTNETEPLRLSDDEYSEDQRQDEEGETEVTRELPPFIWIDYLVFILLGVAMLWSWNMFLAAGPYFQRRFRSNDWISRNFQPAELTVSSIVTLASVLLFTFLQAKANYARRIVTALIANTVNFTLLSMSTRLFTNVSAGGYFGFLLVEVLVASIATGLVQNGIFAYVSGFGREEYTQGIMTGQGIAGVAPPIVQLISVLSAPPIDAQGETAGKSSTSALAYFATAACISFLTLLA